MSKTKIEKKKIEKEVVAKTATPVAETTTSEKPNKILVDVSELDELKKYKTLVKKAQEQVPPAGHVKSGDYEYYADFDKGSSVPAWALPRNVEVLEDEVSKLGSMIKNKQIPIEEIPYQEADYKRKKERLEDIKNARPKLTGLQRDKLVEKTKRLAEEIKKSKFTRLEMEKGLVDPHEEARRMSEPCISVDREEAKRMGIKVNANGKVSRSVAEGMWKNMATLVEMTPANPNTEMLRDDSGNSKRNMMAVPEGFNYNDLEKTKQAR